MYGTFDSVTMRENNNVSSFPGLDAAVEYPLACWAILVKGNKGNAIKWGGVTVRAEAIISRQHYCSYSAHENLCTLVLEGFTAMECSVQGEADMPPRVESVTQHSPLTHSILTGTEDKSEGERRQTRSRWNDGLRINELRFKRGKYLQRENGIWFLRKRPQHICYSRWR